jgi:hypothetical protein
MTSSAVVSSRPVATGVVIWLALAVAVGASGRLARLLAGGAAGAR